MLYLFIHIVLVIVINKTELSLSYTNICNYTIRLSINYRVIVKLKVNVIAILILKL